MSNPYTGDYSSLAELAGEAPPPIPVFDGDFFAEYEDDPEMAAHIMDTVTGNAKRDRDAWFRRHPEELSGYDEGYRQCLIDHNIDPQD